MRSAIQVGVFVGVLLALAPIRRLAADEPAREKPFENRPGWSWLITPFPREDDPNDPQLRSKHGLILLVEEGRQQELVVVIAHSGVVPGYEQWVPVAFDIDGDRHDLRAMVGHRSRFSERHPWAAMDRWGLDPKTLRANQVAYVGLEGFTTEAYIAKAKNDARKATREAKKSGLEVLPYPIVGETYSFRLKDLNGEDVDSRDLRGKVVLLDFWATWCYPCVTKMPQLKQLYEQWHDEGLEVVGINLDHDVETCLEGVKKHSIPWRQSMAPTDEERRDLWKTAMGLGPIPRLLLIDREGNLCADCTPEQLEREVVTLMKKATANE